MAFQRHNVEWTDEKIARFWDFHSGLDPGVVKYFSRTWGHSVAELIDQTIGFSAARNILDVSCGPGDLIHHCMGYLRPPQTITGTDISEDSVRSVNERFGGNPVFVPAVPFQEEATPDRRREFDLVVATEVIEHLSDDELDAFLRSCFQLLASRGSLFLTTPNEETLASNTTICPDCGCIFHRWQHRRDWSAESLRREVEKRGFQTRQCFALTWGGMLRRTLGRLGVVRKWGLVYVGRKP